MRKNLNPADINQSVQLPHPGLGGYSEKEILDFNRDFDDEEKRLKGGDISPLHFSTHQYVQPRYIPCVDEAIANFEEKVILPLSVRLDDKNAPEGQSDQPCAECKSVVVIKKSGCAHCIAVTEEEEIKFLLLDDEAVIEDEISENENQTRKLNRANTKTVNPRIGKGGYTRATSPLRKNTRVKVSTLEARKSERIGVARLKGKL